MIHVRISHGVSICFKDLMNVTERRKPACGCEGGKEASRKEVRGWLRR